MAAIGVRQAVEKFVRGRLLVGSRAGRHRFRTYEDGGSVTLFRVVPAGPYAWWGVDVGDDYAALVERANADEDGCPTVPFSHPCLFDEIQRFVNRELPVDACASYTRIRKELLKLSRAGRLNIRQYYLDLAGNRHTRLGGGGASHCNLVVELKTGELREVEVSAEGVVLRRFISVPLPSEIIGHGLDTPAIIAERVLYTGAVDRAEYTALREAELAERAEVAQPSRSKTKKPSPGKQKPDARGATP
ncbi:hypothetical protein [Paludisphaera borealis]|uniref:Uncharacterized protein n=1 Tax=Paludisphaera borealis TaxID=1387353 RepID=A0A1U7CX89_9BACT|nr:hypothetical protein [Paludisphaera borealis]APW63516.1 hypothetical protein BSF38_05088 [Paludisphaera borealis]